ncbi:MAG: glycosyltransferase family 87 protein [Gemmatimonadota bacterium]
MANDPARAQRVLLRVLLALIVLAAIAAVLIPAGRGWDFANFYDTGRRAAAGQLQDIYNPSALIGGGSPQGQMSFWGAPISAWFYAPLSLFPPHVALILLKLVASLAFAAGLLLLYREMLPFASQNGPTSFWFAPVFALLILLYQPFWTIYRVGGQTTPIVFLLLVLGLMCYLRDRIWAAAICMLFVVLVKPAFLFVPAFLGLVSGRRFFLALATVFLTTAAVSILLLGWPIHREFLEILRRGSGKPSPWPFNSSLYIVADAFRNRAHSIPVPRSGGWFPDFLRTIMKLMVLGTFVFLGAQSLGQEWTADRRRLFWYLLSVSFCLLISQVVWEHYLAVLFIPLSFLVALFPRMKFAERAHLGIILGLCVLQNLVLVLYVRDHLPVSSFAGLLIVSILKAGPLLAYLGFLWFRRDFLFRQLASA